MQQVLDSRFSDFKSRTIKRGMTKIEIINEVTEAVKIIHKVNLEHCNVLDMPDPELKFAQIMRKVDMRTKRGRKFSLDFICTEFQNTIDQTVARLNWKVDNLRSRTGAGMRQT